MSPNPSDPDGPTISRADEDPAARTLSHVDFLKVGAAAAAELASAPFGQAPLAGARSATPRDLQTNHGLETNAAACCIGNRSLCPKW